MTRLRSPLLIALLGAWSIGVHADGTDRIVQETLINAPVEAVWNAYTTKTGVESWMVPHAEVELAVGGKLMTNFDSNGRIGDPQTIEHTILAYEPQRMLAMKIAKAPAGLPYQNAIKQIWSVLYFTPEGGKTRVREVTMGFGPDPESQQLRQFLLEGNRTLMTQLQKRFAAAGATSSGR